MIGGADDKDAETLYEFGRNLGLAFQIQDDLLDTYGDIKVFGKVSGGDIVASKKTFLYVKAMEIASREQRKKLQEIYSSETMDPENRIKMATEIYDQLNIRHISENLAGDYLKTAISFLEKAGVPQERKEELMLMTGSLVGRDR